MVVEEGEEEKEKEGEEEEEAPCCLRQRTKLDCRVSAQVSVSSIPSCLPPGPCCTTQRRTLG